MSKKKQPNNRVVNPRATDDVLGERGWQPSDVLKIMSNPIYAGFGPIPGLLPTDQWVEAAAKMIRETGPERFLHTMLEGLRETFKDVVSFEGDIKPPFGYRLK